MCDPVTLAGLALSTAGGISRGQTQAAYVDAQNAANTRAFQLSRDARVAEQGRQDKFEAESTDRFEDSLEQHGRDDFQATADTAEREFMATVDAQTQALTPTSTLPGQESASKAVQADMAASAAKEAAATRQRVQALAGLQSYGAASQDRGLERVAAGDFLSMLGGLRRGSLAVGAQEQDMPAATVTPGSTTFADILSGLGSVMSLGGGMGTNPLTTGGDAIINLFGGGAGAGAAGAATGLAPLTSLRPQARPAGLGVGII